MKRAYLIIAVSFAFLILGGMTINVIAESIKADKLRQEQFLNVAVPGLLLGFSGIFLWGTGTWAAAKGHPALLGVFLGWLGPIGLLILVFLSDQRIRGRSAD